MAEKKPKAARQRVSVKQMAATAAGTRALLLVRDWMGELRSDAWAAERVAALEPAAIRELLRLSEIGLRSATSAAGGGAAARHRELVEWLIRLPEGLRLRSASELRAMNGFPTSAALPKVLSDRALRTLAKDWAGVEFTGGPEKRSDGTLPEPIR